MKILFALIALFSLWFAPCSSFANCAIVLENENSGHLSIEQDEFYFKHLHGQNDLLGKFGSNINLKNGLWVIPHRETVKIIRLGSNNKTLLEYYSIDLGKSYSNPLAIGKIFAFEDGTLIVSYLINYPDGPANEPFFSETGAYYTRADAARTVGFFVLRPNSDGKYEVVEDFNLAHNHNMNLDITIVGPRHFVTTTANHENRIWQLNKSGSIGSTVVKTPKNYYHLHSGKVTPLFKDDGTQVDGAFLISYQWSVVIRLVRIKSWSSLLLSNPRYSTEQAPISLVKKMQDIMDKKYRVQSYAR